MSCVFPSGNPAGSSWTEAVFECFGGQSPPHWWNGTEWAFTQIDPAYPTTIIYTANPLVDPLPIGFTDFTWTIGTAPASGTLAFTYRFSNTDPFTYVDLGATLNSTGIVTLNFPIGATYFEWGITALNGTALTNGGAATVVACSESGGQFDFNCECEPVSPWDTLANVRKRMLIRLGYPNQATTPPPGMAALIDEWLRSAQRIIYRQVQRAGRRTERFYHWTMKPGLRYYGLQDNEDSCDYKLDPEKVTWVGFEDLNQAWYRLDDGIPPEYYTRANISFGWPTRFEIRSCIEIFPAPQAAYTLWVKGDFGLAPLVADTDRFTIDDEAVFLLALGNGKADRGQKDAQLVLTQAGNYIKGVVAGAHGTKRYVPRSSTANPLTPPKFLPLGNDQA